MKQHDQDLLNKLGLQVIDIDYITRPMHIREMSAADFEKPVKVAIQVKVEIDEERFYSMCHLIRLTDMMCESKSQAVQETYNHLVTLLELSK